MSHYINSRLPQRCPCNHPFFEKCRLVINDSVRTVTPYLESSWKRSTETAAKLRNRICKEIWSRWTDESKAKVLATFSNLTLPDNLEALTKEKHRQAHQLPFNTKLMKGTIEKEEYITYLENHLTVFEKLEAIMASSSDPLVRSFYKPELNRSEKIREDLRKLGVSSPRIKDTEYSQHLESLRNKPHMLIAHVYTNYLRELAGGQFIKPKLEAAEFPVNFYTFDQPLDGKTQVKDIREYYRNQILANVNLTTIQKEEVFLEVLKAFDLSIKLIPGTPMGKIKV